MDNEKNTGRLWVLGASDPEMAAIERLLTECGERVAHAVGSDGDRVYPGNAYRAIGFRRPNSADLYTRWDGGAYLVECNSVAVDAATIDHHRPGDPGYGRPPEGFLPASSIGQVYRELCRLSVVDGGSDSPWYSGPGSMYCRDKQIWYCDTPYGGVRVPDEIVLTAAADHCLGHAYAGRCPGVDPDVLMQWRVKSRAAHQGRAQADVLADVERARAALRNADKIYIGVGYKSVSITDMRGQHVPELPEASAREGICFVADALPGPDGRVKVVCQSGSPEQIQAFMDQWGPSQGLVSIYGDPARGFAGGYMSS